MEVQEKASATLLCEVPASATMANWFMEETRIEESSKYRMQQDGTLRRLTIHNVTTNDDAVYICEMAEGSRTVAELTVLGTDPPPNLLLLLCSRTGFCLCGREFSFMDEWQNHQKGIGQFREPSKSALLAKYTTGNLPCNSQNAHMPVYILHILSKCL